MPQNQSVRNEPDTAPTRSRRRRGRKGYVTLEVIVAILILFIASIVVFQFGIALAIKQSIVHASTVAARESAKGAAPDVVRDSINRIIGSHGLTIGPYATVIIEEMNQSIQFGSHPCESPNLPTIDSDKVRVTLCVSMKARPFLNSLVAYGIDFSGRTIIVHSVATKE